MENPKPRSKGKYRNYGEWQKDRKGPLSYQDRLRLAIDTALAERPADLDEFLALMKRAGYEVKKVRGGGISFRLTGQGQERFTRLRASTLGDGYDLQDVLAAIEGKEKRPGHSERKISLAVDIQAKLAAGKGPGYERWAKVFNIKQMAAALAYIQDNGLTDYEQLAQKATEAADRFHAISEQVKQTEQAMKTNAGLKAATVQYAKTRPVFEQYKATKYSRKFLAEHEADLELYRGAQAEMRSLLGGAKLPKMDVLKEEGRKLTAKKKQLYGLSTDALFVDNEVNKGGNRLENYARALERSKRMMQIIDTAIDLMRRKHKKGEFYYWILYYAYLSPQQCENAGAILQSLETKGISISLRTYYVHRDEAIEVLSSILWGYTSQDCEKITNLLTPD